MSHPFIPMRYGTSCHSDENCHPLSFRVRRGGRGICFARQPEGKADSPGQRRPRNGADRPHPRQPRPAEFHPSWASGFLSPSNVQSPTSGFHTCGACPPALFARRRSLIPHPSSLITASFSPPPMARSAGARRRPPKLPGASGPGPHQGSTHRNRPWTLNNDLKN